MLHNPRALVGQGARRLCPICRSPISIKQVGRPRRFCSDRYRDLARREREFRGKNCDLSEGPSPSEALPGNAEKTSTKSSACGATLVGRAPAVEAGFAVVAIGRGISTPSPVSVADHPKADFIRRALRTEFAARWRRSGLR
jgi:hypothetical protein